MVVTRVNLHRKYGLSFLRHTKYEIRNVGRTLKVPPIPERQIGKSQETVGTVKGKNKINFGQSKLPVLYIINPPHISNTL